MPVGGGIKIAERLYSRLIVVIIFVIVSDIILSIAGTIYSESKAVFVLPSIFGVSPFFIKPLRQGRDNRKTY